MVAKVHTNVNLRDSDRDLIYEALEEYVEHEDHLIKEYTPPADYKPREGSVLVVDAFVGTRADAVDTLNWMRKANQKIVGQTIYRFDDNRLESVMNAMAHWMVSRHRVDDRYGGMESLRIRLVNLRGVDLSEGRMYG